MYEVLLPVKTTCVVPIRIVEDGSEDGDKKPYCISRFYTWGFHSNRGNVP